MAVEVPGKVAEPLVGGADDVAVQLDAGDFRRPERQRREQIPAAPRADDQGLLRLPDVVGHIRDVVPQVLDLAVVARIGNHLRARVDVDVHPELPYQRISWIRRAQAPCVRRRRHLRIAADAHPRVRIPRLVERSRLEAALRPQNAEHGELPPHEGGMAGRESAKQQRRHHRQALEPARPCVRREAPRADARGGGDEEHRGRAVRDLQQENQRHTTQSRSRQIRGVKLAHLLWKSSERQANADARSDERYGDHEVGQGDRVQPDDRRVHEKRDAELRQEAERRQDRKRDRGRRELHFDRVAAEDLRQQKHDQRAYRHPEHGDGNRHEREVVPHGHAEDPGEQDLVHDHRRSDQEQTSVGVSSCRRRTRHLQW